VGAGSEPVHLHMIILPMFQMQVIQLACPDCTQYSIMRTTGGPRDLIGADELVMVVQGVARKVDQLVKPLGL
jgi:hypothetical protein